LNRAGSEPLIAVRVECYAGYRGEETPRVLWLGPNRIDVREVRDRWLAPEHRYFKIIGGDGALYIIRHDVVSGEWELTCYKNETAGEANGA
jgi:hypothetical protein